jgi:hypothetical protein
MAIDAQGVSERADSGPNSRQTPPESTIRSHLSPVLTKKTSPDAQGVAQGAIDYLGSYSKTDVNS